MPTDLFMGNGNNPGAQSLQHRQQSQNNNASTAINQSKNIDGTHNSNSFSTGGYANNSGQSNRLWATVSWMPHASLSQTSHVAISVRAALARIDDACSENSYLGSRKRASKDSWRVSVSVHGLAGLSLVPVSSQTRSVPLLPLHSEDEGNGDNYPTTLANHEYAEAQKEGTFGSSNNGTACKHPSVHETTHVCRWDDDKNGRSIMQIPLRWRDLPRDAYLEFSLKGSRGEEALYETATLSFFDDYGKLRSGLNKLPLFRKSSSRSKKSSNPGLASTTKIPSSQWQDCDDDPVWKASKILEQLDRFDQQNNVNSKTITAGRPNERQLRQLPRKPVSREASPYRNHRGSNTGSNFGNIPSVPWLDRMAREYCEDKLREAKESSKYLVVWSNEEDDEEFKEEETPSAYLLVEIPSFEVPVVHEETFYPTPQQGPCGSVTPLDVALYQREQQQQRQQQNEQSNDSSITRQEQIELEPPPFHPLSAVPFLDYENENDSPIDDKYRTLAHDLLRGLVDPALKPDRIQRDKLAAIIASPSHHPSREEKDLLWRFRFSLVDNRKALTKFLLAVDWTVETEVVQAAELLEQWRKRSPIEVTDALKLLGKQVAYQTNLVRAYAIDTLASAPDEELNLYLLQLVQALKFENSIQQQEQLGTATSSDGGTATPKKKSSLATFLITRASKNVLLANYLYWYLKVELQDPAHGARYREIFDEFKAVLSRAPYPKHLTKAPTGTPARHSSSSASSLASSTSLVNKLGESVSKLVGDKLLGTDNDSSELNAKGGKSSNKSKKDRSVWDVLSDQDKFISGVMDVQMSYQSKAKQPAKEAHLRSVLAKEGYEPPSSSSTSTSSGTSSRLSFPMPCAPEIHVDGLFPEKAKVFKSAVYPALIEFHVDHVVDKTLFGNHRIHNNKIRDHKGSSLSSSSKGHGRNPESAAKGIGSTQGAVPQLSSYRVLMKTGDDLRQDQLVMMMIKLMDRLLKRASLDLCITPYSIIATSPSSGMIEFVEDSCPVSAILANHNNSILQFFQSVAPQQGSKYGIRPDVLSNYVRSVAGTQSGVALTGGFALTSFPFFLTFLLLYFPNANINSRRMRTHLPNGCWR